jgi:hypothetical protein
MEKPPKTCKNCTAAMLGTSWYCDKQDLKAAKLAAKKCGMITAGGLIHDFCIFMYHIIPYHLNHFIDS